MSCKANKWRILSSYNYSTFYCGIQYTTHVRPKQKQQTIYKPYKTHTYFMKKCKSNETIYYVSMEFLSY